MTIHSWAWVVCGTLLAAATACGAEEAAPRPVAHGAGEAMPQVKPRSAKKKRYFRVLTEKEAKELTAIPTRPWPSPITGDVVEIPLADPPRQNCDADLCPHPVGRVTFYSAIPLCPYSGFAAYKDDFMRRQPPEVVAWARRELEPRMRAALRRLFDLNIAMDDRELAKSFKQEDLPDTLRCEHAYLYYTFVDAPATVRAKLAWLTAWADRRAVSAPLQGPPYLMNAVRKINGLIRDRFRAQDDDVEAEANYLAQRCADDTTLNPFERQVANVILAGQYNRLGLESFARLCLNNVRKAASASVDPARDPWLESFTGTPEEVNRESHQRRQLLRIVAERRLDALAHERAYLAIACERIAAGLARGEYAPDKVPAFVYLVGEFERRRENFARADVWLRAAEAILGPEVRVEHFAPYQREMMNDYMQQIRVRPRPSYAGRDRDRVLLGSLVHTVREARATNAPAAPAASADAPLEISAAGCAGRH